MVTGSRACTPEVLACSPGLFDSISSQLRLTLTKAGFTDVESLIPELGSGQTHEEKDPFDQSSVTVVTWYNQSNVKSGQIMLRANNQVYAEIDILKPHPKAPNRFVELVLAWGSGDTLKTELKMLDMP